MAKTTEVIQLPGGIILSKTAPEELLVRVNKKNIFLSGYEDIEHGFFHIKILSDLECHWDWYTSTGRSLIGQAFDAQGRGSIIQLEPYIENLVKCPTVISPEDFVLLIDQNESNIIKEFGRMAMTFGI